jgi:hypothetical protein
VTLPALLSAQPPPLNPMPQNQKKTFTVIFRYLVTVQTEARTEDEAIELASQSAMSEGDWETMDIQVTEENENA